MKMPEFGDLSVRAMLLARDDTATKQKSCLAREVHIWFIFQNKLCQLVSGDEQAEVVADVSTNWSLRSKVNTTEKNIEKLHKTLRNVNEFDFGARPRTCSLPKAPSRVAAPHNRV